MPKERILQAIKSNRLIAVVRAGRPDNVIAALEILYKSGAAIIELTTTMPDVQDLVASARDTFADLEDVCIGVGTVCDADTVRRMIDKGAQFIVGPIYDPAVAKVCRERSTAYIPGAYTPQEIFTAWKAGAALIKIFPTAIGGTDLLESIREPFPQIEFITTHGTPSNAAEHLCAGSKAVCFGGTPLGRLIDAGNFTAVGEMAEQMVRAVGSVPR